MKSSIDGGTPSGSGSNTTGRAAEPRSLDGPSTSRLCVRSGASCGARPTTPNSGSGCGLRGSGWEDRRRVLQQRKRTTWTFCTWWTPGTAVRRSRHRCRRAAGPGSSRTSATRRWPWLTNSLI